MVAGREIEPKRSSLIVHDRHAEEGGDDGGFVNQQSPLLRSEAFLAATRAVESYVKEHRGKWEEHPLYKDEQWEGASLGMASGIGAFLHTCVYCTLNERTCTTNEQRRSWWRTGTMTGRRTCRRTQTASPSLAHAPSSRAFPSVVSERMHVCGGEGGG